MLRKTADFFVVLFQRWMPDAFLFAVLLTFLTFILSIVVAGASPGKALTSWGDGFWSLLSFTAQIATTLFTGYALASTPLACKAVRAFAGLARSAFAAYVLTCLAAMIGAILSWAMALIVGGVAAKETGIVCRKRGIKVHYPLLVAAGYSGYVIWHQALSSSTALLIATPGHFLEQQIGIIPTSETIFTLSNWIIIGAVAATLPFVMAMLRPTDEREIVEIPDHLMEDEEAGAPVAAAPVAATSIASSPAVSTAGATAVAVAPAASTEVATAAPLQTSAETASAKTPAEWLEHARWINWVLAAGGLFVVFNHFFVGGKGLDINILNWIFLFAAIGLSRSPIHFVELVTQGGRTLGPIMLQYPFYAGISGRMVGTGLAAVIAGWFTAISTAHTLPFWAFISGGIINMFIPSGGGQWAVQGPIVIDAAKQLGASLPKTAMGVAIGDQWTNMIQPFWTIPLLAIAGLHVRDIMGYCVITLILTGVIFGVGLLVLPW